jgi:hypothetical protein
MKEKSTNVGGDPAPVSRQFCAKGQKDTTVSTGSSWTERPDHITS